MEKNKENKMRGKKGEKWGEKVKRWGKRICPSPSRTLFLLRILSPSSTSTFVFISPSLRDRYYYNDVYLRHQDHYKMWCSLHDLPVNPYSYRDYYNAVIANEENPIEYYNAKVKVKKDSILYKMAYRDPFFKEEIYAFTEKDFQHLDVMSEEEEEEAKEEEKKEKEKQIQRAKKNESITEEELIERLNKKEEEQKERKEKEKREKREKRERRERRRGKKKEG